MYVHYQLHHKVLIRSVNAVNLTTAWTWQYPQHGAPLATCVPDTLEDEATFLVTGELNFEPFSLSDVGPVPRNIDDGRYYRQRALQEEAINIGLGLG